jgi:predicted HTH transcriptional regulator
VRYLDEASLSALIGTRESASLDFKTTPKKDGNGKNDRRELAKDVAAFANAAGGYLIFGVRKGKDDPRGDVCAGFFDVPEPEQLQTDLDEAIRDFIRSRVVWTAWPVKGETATVVVVRVEPSALFPVGAQCDRDALEVPDAGRHTPDLPESRSVPRIRHDGSTRGCLAGEHPR